MCQCIKIFYVFYLPLSVLFVGTFVTYISYKKNSFTPKLTYIHNFKITVNFEEICLKQDKIYLICGNVVNFFIVYKLDIRSRELETDFTLKDCLFTAFKLTKDMLIVSRRFRNKILLIVFR